MSAKLINVDPDIRRVVKEMAKNLCTERNMAIEEFNSDLAAIVAMRAHKHFEGNITHQLMAVKVAVNWQAIAQVKKPKVKVKEEINLESLL